MYHTGLFYILQYIEVPAVTSGYVKVADSVPENEIIITKKQLKKTLTRSRVKGVWGQVKR